MATVIFYLDKERKNGCLILATFTFNHQRLRLSTGLNVTKKVWNDEEQRAYPLKDHAETNKRLREINSFLLDTYDKYFSKGLKPTKEETLDKTYASFYKHRALGSFLGIWPTWLNLKF